MSTNTEKPSGAVGARRPPWVKMVLVALVCGAPTPLFGLVEHWALYGAGVLVFAGAGAALWRFARADDGAAHTTLEADPLLLLLALSFVWTALSTAVAGTWGVGLPRLALGLLSPAVYVLVRTATKEGVPATCVGDCFLAGVTGAAVVGLAGFALRRAEVWGVPLYGFYGRVTGTFACPNYFAEVLVLGAAVAFMRALERPRTAWCLALAILVPALVLTYSRGGYLGLVAALIVAAVLGRRSPGGRRARLGRAPAAILVAVLLVCAVAPLRHKLALRAASTFGATEDGFGGGQSVRDRFSIWRSSLLLIRDAPVLGHGSGSFSTAYPRYREPSVRIAVNGAVNEYVERAVENGLAGLGLLLATGGIMGAAFARARQWNEDDPRRTDAAAGLCGLAAVAVHSLADMTFSVPAVLLFLVALAAATTPNTRWCGLQLRWLRVFGATGVGLAAMCAWLGAAELSGFLGLRDDEALRWPRAETRLRTATSLWPWSPTHWIARGTLAHRQARFKRDEGSQLLERAVGYYQRALRLSPRDALVHFYLADAYRQLGNSGECAAEFQKAVNLDPQNALFTFARRTWTDNLAPRRNYAGG